MPPITSCPPPPTRFTARAEQYAKHRPSYPPGIIKTLTSKCHLSENSNVADIGAGTGIFTRLLLDTGATVCAIEPNDDMRATAESSIGERPGFTSCNTTAEATGLPDASVDIITCAQAFHWFDREKCKPEFRRILKPDGWLALIWNERLTNSGFMQAYEELLQKYAENYNEVNYRNVTSEIIAEFFAPGSVTTAHFDYCQKLTLEAKQGRLMSASYAPRPGDPRYEPMMNDLRIAFDTHNKNGIVRFEYDTVIYFGRMNG